MINDTSKHTKLMRGENLIWWLIVERFVKVRNNVLKKEAMTFLKGRGSSKVLKDLFFFFFYFLKTNVFFILLYI